MPHLMRESTISIHSRSVMMNLDKATSCQKSSAHYNRFEDDACSQEMMLSLEAVPESTSTFQHRPNPEVPVRLQQM